MTSTYCLDASVQRSRDGRVVSGGQPARVLRLSPKGAAVVDAALSGRAPTDPAPRSILDRLVEYGLLHPVGDAELPVRVPVSFVVPVKDEAASIGALVTELLPLGPVIVVDDGSSDATGVEAARAGARVVANVREAGPAGARNTGLALVGTELVAFVDSDCVPRPGWLAPLVSLFEEPRLALAAPRVKSLAGRRSLARYEQACSPLDMGPDPALVGPGLRMSYVPSAAIVARTRALRGVGGFEASLQVGEDVDLVWRLARVGWCLRYVPQSVVAHRPRSSLTAFARQRFRYGRSAAALHRRHPGNAAPLHLTFGTTAVWLAALVGRRPTAVALAAATLPAGLAARDTTARWHALHLASRSHVVATRHLARAIAREWLPIALLAAAGIPATRRVTAAALALDVALAHGFAKRGCRPAAFAALRLLDNTSYASGLWSESLRLRTPGALLPRPPARVMRAHEVRATAPPQRVRAPGHPLAGS